MHAIGPTQGVAAWIQAADRSAAAINRAASQAVSEPTANTGASADLVEGMVGLGIDAIGVRASVAVIRTQDQMLGALLDMFA